ncbi:hypothetical protein AAVH_33554, partial [Aphelenchoides avenae]
QSFDSLDGSEFGWMRDIDFVSVSPFYRLYGRVAITNPILSVTASNGSLMKGM